MSMAQLQFSYAGSGGFTPLPLADLSGGYRHGARHVAGMARQHEQGGQISALAEKEGREALSRGAALRAPDAGGSAKRPSRRGARAQRPCRVACADLRFSQFCERRAFSVDSVYRPRRQYQPAQRVARPREAERVGRRQLATPLRRGLAGRAFCLRQETNAYGILPPRNGAAMCRAGGPAPPSGTWGDHPPLPDALTLACQERRRACPRWCGSWNQTSATGWRCPWRGLGAELASRAKTPCFIGLPACPCNLTDSLSYDLTLSDITTERKRSRVRTRPVFVRHMRP